MLNRAKMSIHLRLMILDVVAPVITVALYQLIVETIMMMIMIMKSLVLMGY